MKNTAPRKGLVCAPSSPDPRGAPKFAVRGPAGLRWTAIALALAAVLSDPVHAQETETETRLREVEAMMQKMTRELEALKLQVNT